MRPRLSAAGGGAGLLLFVAAVSAAALALAEAFGKVGVAERSRLGKALLWDSLSTAGGGGGEGQHGVSPNRLNRHILRERGEGGGESNDVRREMQFGATNGRLSKSGGGGTRPNSVSSDEAVGRKREALKRLLARRMWKKRLRNALKMKEVGTETTDKYRQAFGLRQKFCRTIFFLMNLHNFLLFYKSPEGSRRQNWTGPFVLH